MEAIMEPVMINGKTYMQDQKGNSMPVNGDPGIRHRFNVAGTYDERIRENEPDPVIQDIANGCVIKMHGMQEPIEPIVRLEITDLIKKHLPDSMINGNYVRRSTLNQIVFALRQMGDEYRSQAIKIINIIEKSNWPGYVKEDL